MLTSGEARAPVAKIKEGNTMLKVTCFGAAGSVTGSNFLVETSRGKNLIVDCGLFQGGKEMERRNWEGWGYDPKGVKNLVLTHAHIDHSGRIPKIVKDGFRGRIITSPPTAELCKIMLLDSAHVQEMDAEWQTKKNRRQGKQGIEPLYKTRDAEESLRYLVPTELDQTIDLDPGTKVRLRNAGHVLGSAIAELWVEDEGKETKLVFTGDLGKHDQLIVGDPFEIVEADYLFIESTYGDRLHRAFEESKAELLDAIKYAVSNKEKMIIPAFALERTQEILYLLGEFSRAGQLPDIPVYLDSPLAIKATEIFRRNKKYYDADCSGHRRARFRSIRYAKPQTDFHCRPIHEDQPTEGIRDYYCRKRYVHRGPDQTSPEAQFVAPRREHRYRRIPGRRDDRPADRERRQNGHDFRRENSGQGKGVHHRGVVRSRGSSGPPRVGRPFCGKVKAAGLRNSRRSELKRSSGDRNQSAIRA